MSFPNSILADLGKCARVSCAMLAFAGVIDPLQAQSLSEARELVDSRRFHTATVALTRLLDSQSLQGTELAQAFYLRGESQYQRSRLTEARADFARAVELDANLAPALFKLGLAEHQGWGDARDPVRARELLRQAADAGIGPAAMELATSYLSASPPEVQQGLAALEQAAMLGHRDAAYTLGELHRVGQFVGVDAQTAFRWHAQAAELGHAAAMFRVSMAYLDGNGVAPDAAVAETWLQRSVTQGYSEALHFAGFRFETQGDMVQANQHYWLAAQAGLARAQINLGISCMLGNRGVRQDFAKAYYWFTRASGAPLASFYRGRLLEFGRGVEPDLAAAYAAYEAAARSSTLPEARAHVALFLDLGRGVQADPQRAAQYFAEFAGYQDPGALNSIAWALATHPAASTAHRELALELAMRATALAPDPAIMDTLAAAHAANGDFGQAMAVLQEAMQVVNDDALARDFAAHLASYNDDQRWFEDLPTIEPDNAAIPSYPVQTTVFTGEILGVVQGRPGNGAANVTLDVGDSDWAVVVRIGRVEQGELPQHLQELAVFHMHSPTELFARLPGNVSFVSPPQGEYRFTLSMAQMDLDLTMEPLTL